MKKGKIIWIIINVILLFISLFLLFLLNRSANWFLLNFHEVEIATALYQISSPLKGTEAGVINDYMNQCLYPSISLSIISVVIYSVYSMIEERLLLAADVQIGALSFHLKSGKRRSMKAGKMIVLCVLFALLGSGLYDKAVAAGLPEYIESVTERSTLFETYYVDPDDVDITFPEKKRNLLIIYLESMEATYASKEEGGGKLYNYIPELTELAEKNLYFSDDDDLGGARRAPLTGCTMWGILASSAGVPYKLPIEGNSSGEYEKFLPGLKGMGEILEENGYQNYFMCGSDVAFGGRKDFYEQHGNYHIFDYNTAVEDGIIPEDYYEFWGMEDAKLYEYAKQELTDIAQKDEPFNFTMLTVDTHRPDGYVCSLCENTYPSQYENVLACASRQADQFIDWVREQEWYENTTVVITGDHLNMKVDFWDDIGDYERTIYNCFLNLPDGLVAAQTQNRIFTIFDMFPTILTAAGVDIEGERLGLGIDLFSDQRTLAEQMGLEMLKRELELYSNYYYMNFVVGSRN